MNKQPKGSDFLRLVSSNKVQIPQSPKISPHNMKSSRDVIFVLISEKELFGGTFSSFAHKFRPDFILDFRQSPRLDLLAGSRMKSFELFSEIDAKYLDVSGRAGSSLVSEVWEKADFLSDIINRCALLSSKGRGVITIFLDDEDSLVECQSILMSKNTNLESGSASKMDMRVSHYRSGLLAL